MSVVGWLMAPKIFPYASAKNLWLCYLAGKRDSGKVIQFRILRWGDYPRFSVGGQGNLNAITHILLRVKQRQIRHTEKSGTEGFEDAGLRLEWCTIRSAGSHQTLGEARNRFSPTAFRGSVPCWHLNVHPVILMSDFWSPEQWQNLLQLLLSQFMAICHRSHGN